MVYGDPSESGPYEEDAQKPVNKYMSFEGELKDMPEKQAFEDYDKKPFPDLRRTGDGDIDVTLEKCLDIMRTKGVDYTIGSNDRLHNFRTVAEFTGQTMEEVWGAYFYKHVSALFSYIKDPKRKTSEPIAGRVQDCIVYLLLFSKMIEERRFNERPKMSSCGVPEDSDIMKVAAESVKLIPDLVKERVVTKKVEVNEEEELFLNQFRIEKLRLEKLEKKKKSR